MDDAGFGLGNMGGSPRCEFDMVISEGPGDSSMETLEG